MVEVFEDNTYNRVLLGEVTVSVTLEFGFSTLAVGGLG